MVKILVCISHLVPKTRVDELAKSLSGFILNKKEKNPNEEITLVSIGDDDTVGVQICKKVSELADVKVSKIDIDWDKYGRNAAFTTLDTAIRRYELIYAFDLPEYDEDYVESIFEKTMMLRKTLVVYKAIDV